MKNISNIRIDCNVNSEELVEGLVFHLSREELFDFIVALEEQVQEWEFTYMLINYFKMLEQKSIEEEKK